ncbi:MAG: hypothetical protein ACRD1S_01485 [Vicinamibacterales bacterium]
MTGPTFSLSIHADYRCRHAGACCTAGWEIPVEVHRQPLVGAATLATAGGCRFFDAGGQRLCALHRDHGHDALPMACQQFPRRVLLDDRGAHVALSHFCPTAASMLFRDDVPLEIVADPPAYPRDTRYEGMDARGALPPLLAPDVLMDLESYSAWEREAVRLFARDDWTADQALAALASATATLSKWRPGDGELLDAVTHAFARHVSYSVSPRTDLRLSRPVRRYAAAKVFGSWAAYQSDRLTDVVANVRKALKVLVTEAERICKESGRPVDETVLHEAAQAADYRLLHRVVETPGA